MAVPAPAAPLVATIPVERSCLSSSSTNVDIIMEPVAPMGWPSAMQPPLTFNFHHQFLILPDNESLSMRKLRVFQINPHQKLLNYFVKVFFA